MMLRIVAVIALLFSGLVQAAAPVVFQRPLSLDTGSGVLHGSLLLPRTEQPPPVVLIIAGSGPTDRDGNNPYGGNTDNLKQLALTLAKNNIASVRYDKRGVAASLAATPDERDLTVERYVADAVAWSQKIKADPRFGRLVLLGHSEGALIASLAAEHSGASAVISIAGSGWPIDKALRAQMFDRIPGRYMASAHDILDRLKNGKTSSRVPLPLQDVLRPSVQPYLISLFRQDPAEAFAKVKVPALIIQGTHDFQVGVDNAEILKAAKPDAELALIKGMNHMLRIAPEEMSQQRDSYLDPQLPQAAELGQRVVDFIQRLPAS
ncbi:alpha/beta hydrolase [Pseudomonas sp. NPDC087612]|uniref:alpha/beta hydrolase n=1 Tax=unclassified Pseudomonas TaxID=196821 RepID=UPI0005EB2095|nr:MULTISPECIES: alpha/beta fold hydrolase [unclassified Pseudomonas]KJK19510.1 alpha/beta hydrolase [Pseudomonas sp. 2(2015)]NLU58838.1 alpha/beta hydrolase [Pseudomonas sp. BIGb0427]QPG63101.1 alpha/beta fold hydrolase [Pseudomonas sp. BIGb0427]QVM98127.1 alpha/beta fold hydrolase [Pseudomonas sp. SORT22]UVL54988.1 alpha/beta hydrolase [Pseudomonas sp. B21-035]